MAIDFEIPDGTLPIFKGEAGTVLCMVGEDGASIQRMTLTAANPTRLTFIVPICNLTPERMAKALVALKEELPDADHIRVCWRGPKTSAVCNVAVFAARGKYAHGP